MHKITEKELTLDDFSHEHLLERKDVNNPNDSCCNWNWNWEGCEIIAPIGIYYVIRPDGERVEIQRFFKEGENGWIEIDQQEYDNYYRSKED